MPQTAQSAFRPGSPEFAMSGDQEPRTAPATEKSVRNSEVRMAAAARRRVRLRRPSINRGPIHGVRPGSGTWHASVREHRGTGERSAERRCSGRATTTEAADRLRGLSPANGVAILQSSTAQRFYAFGLNTDALCWRYDGDGPTDLAVYRPSSGTCVLTASNGYTVSTTFTFGLYSDVPVPRL